MNKHQKVFYFNRETFYKFKSTEVNLLTCLICGKC